MSAVRVFVAGHNGMVGSSLVKELQKNSGVQLILKQRSELDLTNQKDVKEFLADEKIDHLYLAAAKVGGIYANNAYPADFLYENLMIQTNVIQGAFLADVRKLLFLGSSCIYPKYAPQPIAENALLTGSLEPTNEPYAIAKIAGLKLCESLNRQYGILNGIDYRSVMPTNLFGPGDNYHIENSHVIPGLLLKILSAKKMSLDQVCIWGSGSPYREFLYVDDCARGAIHIMNLPKSEFEKLKSNHINLGAGAEISIKDLAYMIAELIGFKGNLVFDVSKPDGTPRKLLNSSSIIKSGWRPEIDLRTGLALALKDLEDRISEGNIPLHIS